MQMNADNIAGMCGENGHLDLKYLGDGFSEVHLERIVRNIKEE